MDTNQEPTTIKVVVVGDGSVGKTCILLSYTTDKFPTDYVPTVFDNYTSQSLVITFFDIDRDTAGQETYNRLRTLSYGQADIFLIIFSVVEQSSFENALSKWYPELSKDDLASVPKLFVGNKTDMRSDSDPSHIRSDSANQLIGQQQCKYMECSALTQDGLKQLFDEAIRLALKFKGRPTSYQPIGLADNNNPKPNKKEETVKSDNGGCCTLF